LLKAARFVAASTRPGDRVFVGVGRHDALAYNAPLVYFLAGRKGATRYDNLHPGVATTLPVQQEIVQGLEAAGTRCVVLWDGPLLVEPNESSRWSGVFVLDAFLAGHFRESVRYGAYRVLERFDGVRSELGREPFVEAPRPVAASLRERGVGKVRVLV